MSSQSMSSSPSMFHFPAFVDSSDPAGATAATTGDSTGIFGLFSNLFRPSSSSSSRIDTPTNFDHQPLQKSANADPQSSIGENVAMATNNGGDDVLNKEAKKENNNESTIVTPAIIANGAQPSVRKRLIDYRKSEFRRFWMPDSAGNECYECNEKFNTFRRRHHCRLCGQIFCKNCAGCQMNGTDLGYNGVLRLCNFCAEQVVAHVAMRRERREKLNSFPQIDADDVFIGVPTNGTANLECNGQLHQHRFYSHPQTSITTSCGDQKPNSRLVDQQRKKSADFFDSSHSSSTNSAYQQSENIGTEHRHLEALFEQKMERMLDSLLIQEQLEPDMWKPLLWSLSKRVLERIASLALRNPEALNILDFLHIKKLCLSSDELSPSSAPSEEIINGLAFSQCLVHSAMPASMQNVSLMLLNGTISYERVLEKFTSLEPMLAQERQYLRLQCDRVLSRRVSLLLTESSISTAAVEMLMAEGISIVANVKSKVLLRIARATCADILNSLDAHFLQPRIGFAPDFQQREFVAGGTDNRRKRLLMFGNCIGNFGITVLLKAGSMRELVSAKRLLRFLVLSRYSSRLEQSFLAMFNSVPLGLAPKRCGDAEDGSGGGDFHCHICELNARHNSKNINANNNAIVSTDDRYDADIQQNDANATETFLHTLAKVQLTNSPAIHFSAPYLATPSGRQCPLLPFMKGTPLLRFLRPNDFSQLRVAFEQFQQKLDALERAESARRRANAVAVRHRCLSAQTMEGRAEKLLDRDAWIHFRRTSALHFRRRAELNRESREEKQRRRVNLMAEREAAECMFGTGNGGGGCSAQSDTLSPYNHQGIAFLYCANARRATYRRAEEASRIFCTGPYVLQRQFYHGKDTSLGNFLSNCCFSTDFKCKGCDRPMLEHFRRIVHGNTRIEVVTRNVSASSIARNNSSTSSLTTAAVAAVQPFVSGGVAASLHAATFPSIASDEDLNRALPLDDLPSSIPNNNCASIICWLRCNTCSANSSIVTMPDELFHLSFAKFVDYLSNGTHWVSPFPSSSIDLSECHHCTFHSHSHFFALGNFVAQFRVNPNYPLNVLFAPIPCCGVVNDAKEPPSAQILLRDTFDGKGNPVPDIGSAIAHALERGPHQPSPHHSPQKPEKGSSSASLGSSVAAALNVNGKASKFEDFVDISNADEHYQYSVKVYFPEQFEQFRALTFVDGEKNFIRSLSTSSPWYPQGGKSGAIFSRTDDECFVLKTLNRFELDAFKQCALRYIDYVQLALAEKKLTALCKIFGAFSVVFTNKRTGQTVKSDLIIMEYLFRGRDIKQIWDLKGSLRNRFASTKNDNGGGGGASSSVLLDENYIQNLWRNQLYVSTHSKTALSQAIINDSHFLADQGIMDYSLLAGVCRGDQDEVIIGIVDYMRTFTFDKKVESAIKNAIPLTNSSTVISPEQYCRRFYEAIDGYFAVAPDQWTSDFIFT